jgi:hypothetical protein
VGQNNVVGIAIHYELDSVRIKLIVRVRLSTTIQTGPGALPTSFTMGTGSSQVVKQLGNGINYPTPSSAEVKERVMIYLYSLSGPSWPILGIT